MRKSRPRQLVATAHYNLEFWKRCVARHVVPKPDSTSLREKKDGSKIGELVKITRPQSVHQKIRSQLVRYTFRGQLRHKTSKVSRLPRTIYAQHMLPGHYNTSCSNQLSLQKPPSEHCVLTWRYSSPYAEWKRHDCHPTPLLDDSPPLVDTPRKFVVIFLKHFNAEN